MDVYDQLMELCGFEKERAESYKPTLKKGLEKLLVTEENVKFAVTKRLPDCWSLELKGIRKLLGCWLREFIRIAVPAPEEERLCHTYFAQPGMAYLQPVKIADPRIQIGVPDWVGSFVGAAFFNVGWKYVEAAEREGCAIDQFGCSLNKIRYGLHVLGIVPKADASVGFHSFCDDAPMVDQLINDWDGTRICTPYRVRDIHFKGNPFDEANMKYFADSLEDGHKQLEKWLDIELTPEHKAEAVTLMVELSATVVAPLTEFMKADPAPLNANDLCFALFTVATVFDTGYDDLFEAINILNAELAERVAAGEGVVPKGTPRVSWRLVNPVACPWVVPLCHEVGLSADFIEAFLLGATQFNLSMEAQAETNMYMMMGKFLAMVSALGTSMEYLYDTTAEHIRDYKIDGLISTAYRGCRAWSSHSLILAKMLEERAQIPCITPDFDIFIDRGDFPQERMRTVMETFANIVNRSKAKREGV
jgi:benzoyl-CoA reductase/2-hydroxyglutaryl-CoA dehydratase subunit BcrC/BadD/HgdB